ncbi:hypothetical protein [Methanoregula sp.]|uniref:hypothetical protein n=1 Tax=Methanoregula sp. TaxID=2052170 RepID=UPI003565AAE9
MRDDGVAPVIAVMLILAVAVTFLAVFNGIYIPSLKQSAEIDHIQNVEAAFLKFSSDITYAASSRQDHLSFAEPVQLGGGNVVFNTLRSGGFLSIQIEETPVYNLTLYDASGTFLAGMNGTMVSVTYEPQGNFWQDQGYRWQYGYINVTKYQSRESPLGYTNMTEVMNVFADTSRAFPATVTVDAVQNISAQVNCMSSKDGEGNLVYTCNYQPLSGICSRIDLFAVNVTASPAHSFMSSNGFATLGITSTVRQINTTDVSVSAVSFGAGEGPLKNAAFDRWNQSFSDAARTCPNTVQFDPSENFPQYRIRQDISPVNVTLNVVSIEISAY